MTEKMENNTAPEVISEVGSGSRGLRKRVRLIAGIVGGFLLLILCGLAAVGFRIAHSPENLPNVYVGTVYVGGLTREETAAELEKAGWPELARRELAVTLPADISFRLSAAEAGAVLSEEDAVRLANSYGHSKNPYDCLIKYLKSALSPTDVTKNATALDSEYIRSCIGSGIEQLTKATSVTGYRIDEKNNRLVMTKGGGELRIDEEALYQAIVSALNRAETVLSFNALAGALTPPDFEAILREVRVDPVNAEYDPYFTVIPEVIGMSFDAKEAATIWDETEPGRKVFIPLEITEPEVTGAMLSSRLFCDRLGGQTTSYAWSSEERIGNIKLAAKKINGFIMMPDEVFSYNETIGQRTEEAGYGIAHAYSDGQVVDALGGGICQVSSTLYCASMYAQMKTVSRTNHYFKVDYLDYGMDATVSWTEPDFKFRNARTYPVKITAWCDDETQTLTVEIWGTDLDGSYVTLRTESAEVYDEEYTDVLVGYTVRAYRDIYDGNGNYLDTVSEPGGVYYFHDEDIAWPEGYIIDPFLLLPAEDP